MKTKRKFQNYVIDFVWHLQIKVEIYELTQIVFFIVATEYKQLFRIWWEKSLKQIKQTAYGLTLVTDKIKSTKR